MPLISEMATHCTLKKHVRVKPLNKDLPLFTSLQATLEFNLQHSFEHPFNFDVFNVVLLKNMFTIFKPPFNIDVLMWFYYPL